MEKIRSELRIIISHLAILTRQVQQQEEDSDLSEEWKFVAMVIDRLCLFLFTASMILFTLLTLFSTPMFSKFK
jgi:nicotinic acetylcholine receptor